MGGPGSGGHSNSGRKPKQMPTKSQQQAEGFKKLFKTAHVVPAKGDSAQGDSARDLDKENAPPTIINLEPSTPSPATPIANPTIFQEEEDEDISEDFERYEEKLDSRFALKPGGAMHDYVSKIHRDLSFYKPGQARSAAYNSVNEGNPWILPKDPVASQCRKLPTAAPFYHPKIYVFMPHSLNNGRFPACPDCRQELSGHGFQSNPFARRIIGLSSCTYLISYW
jgi:hypothetical protein